MTDDQRKRKKQWEWMCLLGRRDVVIVDAETTGTGPSDEIVEIGVINTFGDVLIHEYISPLSDISPEAESVHGITRKRLAAEDARPYSDVVAPAIRRHLRGMSCIIAYNAAFDARMLSQTAGKYHLLHGLPPADMWRCAMLDYAEYRGDWNAQKQGYRWWKLGQAAEAEDLDIEPEAEHTAVGDCRTTLALMWAVAVDAKPVHGGLV